MVTGGLPKGTLKGNVGELTEDEETTIRINVMTANETLRADHVELDDCIELLRIIDMNPIDKKLLKQEMYKRFSDYTIKLARKIRREQ